MSRFVRALAVLMILAAPAHAGIVYRYTSVVRGDPFRHGGRSGTVWVNGRSYRDERDLDPSSPRAYDVTISDGTTTRLLNLSNKTWYVSKPAAQRGGPKRDVGAPKIRTSVEESEPIDGHATRKYVIRVDYKIVETYEHNFGGKIEKTKVDLAVGETIMLWTTTELPSVPLDHVTGTLPEAIDEVSRFFATAEGMPLRLESATTRTYKGGRPSTVLVTTTYSDIRQVDVPPSYFEVPANFREQEPVIAAPGVIPR